MIKFSQSMNYWLWEYHTELIVPLMFGHLEEITAECAQEYLDWCKTDEGKSFLVGGCNYVEER